jgi:hypothetical protein
MWNEPLPNACAEYTQGIASEPDTILARAGSDLSLQVGSIAGLFPLN